MTKNDYNCSQQELYSTGRIAWNLCADNLEPFTALKAKYTEGYVTQNLADIEAADDMPDDRARYAPTAAARLELVQAKDAVITCFNVLKRYIFDAYPADMRKTMNAAAGQGYFAKANDGSWINVSSLLSSAIPFMEANMTALIANDNMPATFADNFKAVKKTFETKLKDYNDADKVGSKLTNEKIDLNNAIFGTMTSMLSDAQSIFVQNPSLAKEFVFANLVLQTRGVRQSGINGKVTQVDKKKAIENAVITLVDGDKSVKTPKDGRFELFPVGAGTYTLTIECVGYETVTVKKFVVKTGVMSRLNVVMTAVLVDNLVATI